MPTLILFILAICILYILSNQFLIGFVLAGLLALLWNTLLKLQQLRAQLMEIKEKASDQSTVSKQTSSRAPIQTQAESASENIPEQSPSITAKRQTEDTSTSQTKEFSAVQELKQKPIEPQPSTTQVTPAASKIPGEVTFIEKLIKAAWNWISNGNVFVRVGIIILFFGMTFLIQYSIGKNLIPIEFRLAAVSMVAVALLFWGWRQRNTRQNFSLVIQGGGIGLLYLTIFAGFSLYHVIPPTLAFAFLALTVLFAALLAVFQNAKPLALFATVGGFLAPILTSSGSNNYIGLFSYYTLLNLGVFAIAWFKSWRILNFIGFLFTFAISAAWGVLSYKAEYFTSTEPFLIIFFLLYVAISILYAYKRAPEFKDYIDSSLIFGTPVLAFALQCAMMNDYEYGVAISAASLSVFYLILTFIIWHKFTEQLRLLSETFLSLSVIFATLTIPFAIDGTLTGATWAIEGAGILWISIKQQQKYRRLFGIALIFAASVILASELIFPLGESRMVFNTVFANSVFIGCVIITIAASLGSYLLSREFPDKFKFENTLSNGLLVYAVLVLLAGFEYQIFDFALYTQHGSLLAVLSGASILAYAVSANKLKWSQGHWLSIAFIVPVVIAAILCFTYQAQLAAYYGYFIWPILLIIYFYALKKGLAVTPPAILLNAHIAATFIIACLLFWEGLWQLLLAYSLLAILFNQLGKALHWPQLKILALGFLPVLVFSSIAAIAIDGNLIDLSNIASDTTWPFPPGFGLWPFAFGVYFYLLHQNQTLAGRSTRKLHYAGAILIAALLFWLGLWPLLLGAGLLSILSCLLWKKLAWEEMRVTTLALLPLMILTAFVKLIDSNFDPADLQGFNVNIQNNFESGYLLWPLCFTVLLWSYKQFDQQQKPPPALFHGLSLLLFSLLITWEVSWHLLDYLPFMNAWHIASLPIMAMISISLIMKFPYWPFTAHQKSYQGTALLPLSLFIIVWSLLQLSSSGSSLPLPWLPLINPLDIIQCLIILCFWIWSDTIFLPQSTPIPKQTLMFTLLGFLFLWANIDLLRAVHHWANIAWQLPTLLTADISQTVLSLFWALCGLATTIFASRKANRLLWICGASLLVVVVLKLFLIDLSASDTIERIISFTGVGLLLMLVGYFSPLPPKNADAIGVTNA